MFGCLFIFLIIIEVIYASLLFAELGFIVSILFFGACLFYFLWRERKYIKKAKKTENQIAYEQYFFLVIITTFPIFLLDYLDEKAKEDTFDLAEYRRTLNDSNYHYEKNEEDNNKLIDDDNSHESYAKNATKNVSTNKFKAKSIVQLDGEPQVGMRIREANATSWGPADEIIKKEHLQGDITILIWYFCEDGRQFERSATAVDGKVSYMDEPDMGVAVSDILSQFRMCPE